MNRKWMLVVAVVFVAISIFAQSSDEFIIAPYQHYYRLAKQLNGGSTYPTHAQVEEVAEDLAEFMEDAHFTHVMECRPTQIDLFRDYNIEPILYAPGVRVHSYYNDCEFQAEFFTEGPPPTGFLPEYWPDEMKWYRMTTTPEINMGEHLGYLGALESENFLEITLEDSLSAGLVVDEYRSPWADEYLSAQISLNSVEDYYLSYRMKVDGFESYGGTTVFCKVGAKVLYKNTTTSELEFKFLPANEFEMVSGDGNTYTVTMDNNYLLIDKTDWGNMTPVIGDFVEFQFKISYSTIYSAYSGWRPLKGNGNRHIHLCPVVYYSANSPLSIDYVGVQDDKMVDLLDDTSDLVSAIHDSLDYYQSKGIELYAGLDEPWPGQFASHLGLNEIIENEYSANMIQSVTTTAEHFWDAFDSNYNAYHLISRAYPILGDPNELLPQFYPVVNGKSWNIDPTSPYAPSELKRLMQYRFSIMTETYRLHKLECVEQESNVGHHINFYPIVQSYGVIDASNDVWSTIQPPSKTQMALAYLPLCYQADGVFYYVLENYGTSNAPYESAREEYETVHFTQEDLEMIDNRNEWYTVGIVNKHSWAEAWTVTNQYYALQEANAEISVIGPILKDLNWDSDNTKTLLPDSTDFDLVNGESSSVWISASDDTGIENQSDYYEGYEGYVECSAYNDGSDDFFMLVNRRANFSKNDYTYTSGWYQVNSSAIGMTASDSVFADADNQQVAFLFSDALPTAYQLINVYTGETYQTSIENGVSVAEVEMGPGEAMLLKLQQTIPDTLTQSLSVSNFILSHDVVVPATKCLTLSGNVRILNDAKITVEDNADMVIIGTNYVGSSTDSTIVVKGELTLYQGTLKAQSGSWKGIDCLDGGVINMSNFLIEDASIGIMSNGGELNIEDTEFKNCSYGVFATDGTEATINNSLFEVRENGYGLLYYSSSTHVASSVVIDEASTDSTEFVAMEEGTGKGILISTSLYDNDDYLEVSHASFTDLYDGINLSSTVAAFHAIDSCSFSNCTHGIYLYGNGSSEDITHCDFDQCDIGINDTYMKVLISECSFSDNTIGVCTNHFDNSGPLVLNYGVEDCSFDSNEEGIRMLDSTYDIEGNLFSDNTDSAIRIADNSYPDISSSSINVFDESYYALDFLGEGEEFFRSSVLMTNGHNDFYGASTGGDPADLHFSEYYDGRSVVIEATGNYWNDSDIGDKYDCADSLKPSIVSISMDKAPNGSRSGYIDIGTRFYQACTEKDNGNFEGAITLFETILNDRLETEISDWSMSVALLFNMNIALGNDLEDLISYYQTLIVDIPEFMNEDQYVSFCKVLKNYQKKCYVWTDDLQSAADIVAERLASATNPADSLYAVMDMEAIYMLADMGEERATLRTGYPQHKPDSMEDYQLRTKNHWDDLYLLYGITEEEPSEENVPAAPVLSMNYPNPFNPTTTICFSIPEASKVEMDIYNIKGQRVKKLVNDDYPRGNHKVQWHGDNATGKQVSSGVYFYRLKINGKSIGVKKMLMLK